MKYFLHLNKTNQARDTKTTIQTTKSPQALVYYSELNNKSLTMRHSRFSYIFIRNSMEKNLNDYFNYNANLIIDAMFSGSTTISCIHVFPLISTLIKFTYILYSTSHIFTSQFSRSLYFMLPSSSLHC